MFELHLTREELWIIELALGGELVALSSQMKGLAKTDWDAYENASEEYLKVSALSKRTWAMLEETWGR